MIEIKKLYKSFGDLTVFDGASIKVEDGQSLVVMGKSGQGKSVLLKLITRLLYPDSGNIYIDGEDLGTLNPNQLVKCRLKFGMLFQSAALFDSLNICDNVGIGLKAKNQFSDSEIETKVQESLEIGYCLPH